MSALIRPFKWGWSADNIGAASDVTPGTSFTAKANNATDGTVVAVLSALPYDACRIAFSLGGSDVSGQHGRALAQIMYDPAGGTSWVPLIPDQIFGGQPWANNAGGASYRPLTYDYPLWIPAGSTIGIRGQSNATTDRTGCFIQLGVWGLPSNPEQWWCGTKIEALGIGASSAGTAFTPGNSGAYGSWTTIGTSTRAAGAVQFGVQGGTATQSLLRYLTQVGHGSQRLAGVTTQKHVTNTSEVMVSIQIGGGPDFADIPAGTAMQLRGACSGTAQNLEGAVYLVG